jgi:hypothetical protein
MYEVEMFYKILSVFVLCFKWRSICYSEGITSTLLCTCMNIILQEFSAYGSVSISTLLEYVAPFSFI